VLRCQIAATRVKRCIAVSAWLSSVPEEVHDGIFGATLALLPKRWGLFNHRGHSDVEGYSFVAVPQMWGGGLQESAWKAG
jgi:hypothetical protein